MSPTQTLTLNDAFNMLHNLGSEGGNKLIMYPRVYKISGASTGFQIPIGKKGNSDQKTEFLIAGVGGRHETVIEGEGTSRIISVPSGATAKFIALG